MARSTPQGASTSRAESAQRFHDKVVVVTGAGSGIGLATARAFAREGAWVGIVDLDPGSAEEAKKSIVAAGGRAESFACDVSQASEVERTFAAIGLDRRRIDALFNNAGINPGAPFYDLTEDLWDRVLGTNLKGPWLCANSAAPYLRAAKGAIVNCASVNSIATVRGAAAYAASKAGLIGLTKAMALDVGADGVRVNAVLPGSTETPLMWRGVGGAGLPAAALEELRDSWRQGVPLGRLAEPEDIAALVLFLCSAEASYITGGSFLVDGGMLAQLPGVP